jgi:hypothetical protein
MDNGLTIKCMAGATSSGPMVSNTLASSKRIRDMDRAASSGKMEESTKEVGTRVSSMELDSIPTIRA